MLPLKLIVLFAVGISLLSPNALVRAAGGTITGQVLNGTTGRPVANQTLHLLLPREGMQRVATAETDARGRFVMAPGDVAADAFYLLQATYQDVTYNAPVTFDESQQARANITVYDSTRAAPALRIQSARIVVHVEGGKAHVQEMFALRNSAEPPRTYVNPDGTFRFHLSGSAGAPSAAVAGLMNMPLPQPVNPGKGVGNFSIQYPLKPGLTVMMVAYDSDYASGRLHLADSFDYPIDKVELLVSPPNLSVESGLFKATDGGADSASRTYLAENLPPHAELSASVSGNAAAGEAPAGEVESQSQGDVITLPNSMTRLGGPLLACFLLVLLWGLGVRVAREWPGWKARRSASERQKALEIEAEKLFDSIADLDELFDAGKIAEKPYWIERLEMKARLVAALKKAPAALLESYASRHAAR